MKTSWILGTCSFPNRIFRAIPKNAHISMGFVSYLFGCALDAINCWVWWLVSSAILSKVSSINISLKKSRGGNPVKELTYKIKTCVLLHYFFIIFWFGYLKSDRSLVLTVDIDIYQTHYLMNLHLICLHENSSSCIRDSNSVAIAVQEFQIFRLACHQNSAWTLPLIVASTKDKTIAVG